MRNNQKIGVMILAGGSSSRLGHPKQLVQFRDKPLLQHMIDIAMTLHLDQKVLVLGAKADTILEQIDTREMEVVTNTAWKEGMASSIRAGLDELLKNQADLQHALILLSDQPLVTREQIQRLIEQQLNSDVQATFSEYDGVLGVPAIFSKELFSELQKLKGDQGAKKLFKQSDLEYKTLKFEAGVFDVDTQEDVELLKQLEK